jgi:hypothetical protein
MKDKSITKLENGILPSNSCVGYDDIKAFLWGLGHRGFEACYLIFPGSDIAFAILVAV